MPRRNTIAFAYALPLTLSLLASSAPCATSISQFGITWTFDGDYESGQFANGDYWVAGRPNLVITGIDPASTNALGRITNGSMINPDPTTSAHGYDEQLNGFDPALNAARPGGSDLSAANPLTIAAGSSLISTVSIPQAGERPQLQTAAILTVLSEAPADGSFRPPYCGDTKTIEFNKSDLNYALLRSLDPVADTPQLSTVESYFEKPWTDHIAGWYGRYFHPADNMPDYGREISNNVGIGALMLHLDFSNQEKETLLIRYVQLGIDNFGIVENGATNTWSNDGGHASGRKWPIVFAGLMLDDNDMKTMNNGTGEYVHFGEDDQTFYVTQSTIDITNGPTWDPDTRADTVPYTTAQIGMPEWGIRHYTAPSRDNMAWGATYRTCCTATAWPGFVLAAHLMGAVELWDHDALFDYMDRYMAIAGGDPDPFGYTVPGESAGYRSWSSFAENMWDTYRDSTAASVRAPLRAAGSHVAPATTPKVHDLMGRKAVSGAAGIQVVSSLGAGFVRVVFHSSRVRH
jgi:hypothetical protein